MGQDGKNAGAGKAFREDQKIIESVLKQDRSIWEQVEREDTPFLEEPYLSRSFWRSRISLAERMPSSIVGTRSEENSAAWD